MASKDVNIDKKIKLLIDKDEIRDLIFSYCQTVDRLDYDRIKHLYHKDSKDDHGYNSSGSLEEFIEMLKSLNNQSKEVQHLVCNSYIKIDGDYAEAETYLLASQWTPDKGGHGFIQCGARYLDKFIRDDNVWMFHRRCLVIDWARRVEASSAWDNEWIAPVTRGCTGPADPSYEHLTLFKWGAR
jgi:hypothetical protein